MSALCDSGANQVKRQSLSAFSPSLPTKHTSHKEQWHIKTLDEVTGVTQTLFCFCLPWVKTNVIVCIVRSAVINSSDSIIHITKSADYGGKASLYNPNSTRHSNWEWEKSFNLFKQNSCFVLILLHIPLFCLPSLVLLWGSPQKGFMYWSLNLYYFLTHLLLPSHISQSQGSSHGQHPDRAETPRSSRLKSRRGTPAVCGSAALPTAAHALRSWQHH